MCSGCKGVKNLQSAVLGRNLKIHSLTVVVLKIYNTQNHLKDHFSVSMKLFIQVYIKV